jgi:hypothetical protein
MSPIAEFWLTLSTPAPLSSGEWVDSDHGCDKLPVDNRLIDRGVIFIHIGLKD